MSDYTINFRPYTAADTLFIQAVYASTRETEMASVDWPAEQKEAFLNMQCQAQLAHYQAHYIGATHEIILRNGIPVGRIYIHRRPKEIRLMDITLLPIYRNQGIGTRLIQDIIREADLAGQSVTLHVEIFNHGALRLYQRLGFTAVPAPNHQEVYLFLERLPLKTLSNKRRQSIS